MVLQVGRFLQLKQLPWLPRTRSSDGLRLSAVPPVARLPGTTLALRRRSLGWVRLADHLDLQAWLQCEDAPAEVVYHVGSLSEARRTDPKLDLLAFAVLVRSSARVPRSSPCGHWRGGWIGSGDVTLRQLQLGPGCVAYLAKRRATAPTPTALASRSEPAGGALLRRAG